MLSETRKGSFVVLPADISSFLCNTDMLKDIGMNTSGGAIFLPHSPGNVADVSAEVQPSLASCFQTYAYMCW